jgi:transcriptional regulator with XRE-family HTH domain
MPKPSIGERIKTFRAAHGLTQKAFAKLAALGESTIGLMETDRDSSGPKAYQRVEKVLAGRTCEGLPPLQPVHPRKSPRRFRDMDDFDDVLDAIARK